MAICHSHRLHHACATHVAPGRPFGAATPLAPPPFHPMRWGVKATRNSYTIFNNKICHMWRWLGFICFSIFSLFFFAAFCAFWCFGLWAFCQWWRRPPLRNANKFVNMTRLTQFKLHHLQLQNSTTVAGATHCYNYWAPVCQWQFGLTFWLAKVRHLWSKQLNERHVLKVLRGQLFSWP